MTIKLDDIQNMIQEFITTSPLNKVEELNSLVIYDAPLIGAASADDPLFSRLKDDDVVGSHHLLPAEWLVGAKTVISYFLPFTERIREANRKPGIAATEWLYGRIEGEIFDKALRNYLLQQFQSAGLRALSPGLDERYAVVKRRSNWSERHVAFIAGLGTFSLSRSLITKRGCAGRFGSIVLDVYLEPTPRPYTVFDEYCIKCGACILRCPPLAINETGKDNAICGEYLNRVLDRFRPRYGCGKCQTKVPCEDKIPKRVILHP